jgi:ATP-binding cassette subfamily C protein
MMYGLEGFHSIWVQLREEKKAFFRVSLYGIFSALLLIPIPMFFPLLIDELLLSHPGKMVQISQEYFGIETPWVLVVCVLGIVFVLRGMVFVLENRKAYHTIGMTQKLSATLRIALLRHLQSASLKEYEMLKSGSIATKTIQDVEVVSSFVSQVVSRALTAIVFLIGVAAVLFWMNWILALLVLTVHPFFLAFSKLLGRKTGKLLKRKHEAYQVYQELLHETLELLMQIRAASKERHFFGLLEDQVKQIEKQTVAYSYQAEMIQRISSLLSTGMVDIFRALGIIAVVYSDLTVGMMIGFLFYLATLSKPLQELMNLLIVYHRTKPALERIQTIFTLEQEPEIQSGSDPFTGKVTVSVRVENLSFSYREKSPVLSNVSLFADRGETIAVVGASGSGKTTLAQLLVGFYVPQKGEIYYDDTPVGEIGYRCVREHVALMLQHTLFFNDTIRMNLTLAADKSDEEIFQALHAAQLDGFVKALDQGLDTFVGKNGIRLSGGQKQRLAIARLLLADPKVVIFDEATSSLDNQTEFDLYTTLSPFLRGRTTIIIAHRTTTIKQANRIYVLERGCVAAEGTYDTLQKEGWLKEDFDV